MKLRIDTLSGGYDKKEVCKSISFTLDNGEVLALVGANGSGKTSLIKLILGIIKKTSGTIYINGRENTSYSKQEISTLLAYIPQQNTISFPITVLDMVLMGRSAHIKGFSMPSEKDIVYAQNTLKKLHMEHLENEYYDSLSSGWKQMVLIARALCQNAQILLMDEPTASLDYYNQHLVISTIKELSEQGYSILVSSHDLNHPFIYADKSLILKHGKAIAFGKTAEILTSINLSAAYGLPIELVTTRDSTNTLRTICVST